MHYTQRGPIVFPETHKRVVLFVVFTKARCFEPNTRLVGRNWKYGVPWERDVEEISHQRDEKNKTSAATVAQSTRVRLMLTMV